MLVVTANWSISDGTLAAGPTLAQTTDLVAFVRRSAIRAGLRRDGRYRPIDRVELVFAGDTFDWLLTAAWLGRERPWRRRARCEALAEHVVQAAARQAAPLLRRLARLARRGLEVAAADGFGRPVFSTQTSVPVRVVLLAGDRDPWIDEPRPARMAGRFAVAVGRVWAAGAVTAMHGHTLDPLCGPADVAGERPPTLQESLVVDLIVPFLAALHDDGMAGIARRRLRSLPSAAPLDMAGHLHESLERAVATDAMTQSQRGRIEAAWARAVDAWWQRARRDVPVSEVHFDAVDAIAARLRLEAVAGEPEATAVHPLEAAGRRLADGHGIMVYGHLPAGAGVWRPPAERMICLGPEPVRRCRRGWAAAEAAVDVSIVAPAVESSNVQPRTVAVFAPDEAGNADWAVSAIDGAAPVASRGASAAGGRIIDAA